MCFYDFILLNHDIQITGKKLRTHGTDLCCSCFYGFILLNHNAQITEKKLRTHFAGTRTIPEENLDQPAEENGTGKSKVRLPG